jgi:hypothetical protein
MHLELLLPYLLQSVTAVVVEEINPRAYTKSNIVNESIKHDIKKKD